MQVFSCTNCGAQTSKWSGRCLECGRWGTVKEDEGAAPETKGRAKQTAMAKPAATRHISEVSENAVGRAPTGDADLDRILGGGLVAGEVVLLAGAPGVGKSTLLLAIAASLGRPVLYVAGEESPEQISIRARRLGATEADIRFVSETDADTVAATIVSLAPGLAIVDSIQTLRADGVASESGSPWQVRAAGAKIAEAAKRSGVPTILVGQVTKDGSIAGPKTLEHLVDVVLSFEGDAGNGLRLLRAEKNRFGPTDEVAVFRMTERGLVPEPNPSRLLLADRRPGTSGSAITCFLEGLRPIMTEVQALTTRSSYGTPIRRASGYDLNRLQMIIAVLERRAGVNLAASDVHVNVVGGMSLRDESTDLAVALAIASAVTDRPLANDLAVCGEIGLGGEVRSVPQADRRAAECAALGFGQIMLPDAIQAKGGIAVLKAKTLIEAIAAAGIR